MLILLGVTSKLAALGAQYTLIAQAIGVPDDLGYSR